MTRIDDCIPLDLVLTPASRWPTTLQEDTVRVVLNRPLPASAIGARLSPAASVVIVTSNNLVFARLCLESLLANTGGDEYEIVVIDNGSHGPAATYLGELARRQPHIRLTVNAHNLGFARAVNQGLRLAAGRVLVILNDDTIVPPGWLAPLLARATDPRVGLVGPVSNRAGNEAEIEAPYRTYGEMVEFARQHMHMHRARQFDIAVATMFCAALRREVCEQIGHLDEQFEIGLFEDDDYSMRVRAAGFRVVCAEDVFVHHFGQASIGKLAASEEYGPLFTANRRRWEAKWGTPWRAHRHRASARYAALVDRLRAVAASLLPSDALVLVVSKGDDELINLGTCRAVHFPQTADGVYAGYHPKDSEAAIAALEQLRAKGAQFLLFPCTSAWWLDHYGDFASHLDRRHDLIFRDDDVGVIYALGTRS